MTEKVYCKVCEKTTEWKDTETVLPDWHPKTTAYKCTECGTEAVMRTTVLQYLTKERKSIPQPCPKCKSVNVKFHYTEPDYGDAWKCLDCETIFPGWGKTIPSFQFYPVTLNQGGEDG